MLFLNGELQRLFDVITTLVDERTLRRDPKLLG